MSKLQGFSIGMVMAAIGIAAILQVVPVDHVIRTISIMAVGCVAILGALVFFMFAFSERDI